MPKVNQYRSKHEKASGVPNWVVVYVYMNMWRVRYPDVKPDTIATQHKEMDRFVTLMCERFHQYAGASRQDLGLQLIYLRKAGKIRSGPPKPRLNVERMIAVFRMQMIAHAIDPYKIESIIQGVKEDLRSNT